MTRPFSRVVDAVVAIAEKLGATVGNTGNRLADGLEAIGDADLRAGVPEFPEEDGTYVLKVTVSDGEAEAEWVVEQ